MVECKFTAKRRFANVNKVALSGESSKREEERQRIRPNQQRLPTLFFTAPKYRIDDFPHDITGRRHVLHKPFLFVILRKGRRQVGRF
jgi:hypothetical protein